MKSARENGEGMPMPELPYPNVFGAKAMPKVHQDFFPDKNSRWFLRWYPK
jgi:hypothetical protein